MGLNREEPALRILLIDVARRRATATYAEMAEAIRPFTSTRLERPFTPMHTWLGSVSRLEHERERPLLSALVVGVHTRLPGSGFFTLARNLGYEIDDEKAFAERQAESCYETWAANRREALMQTHRLELSDGTVGPRARVRQRGGQSARGRSPLRSA